MNALRKPDDLELTYIVRAELIDEEGQRRNASAILQDLPQVQKKPANNTDLTRRACVCARMWAGMFKRAIVGREEARCGRKAGQRRRTPS